jgi:hypothetical protein
MTPLLLAEQWHLDHDPTRSFSELLGEYLATGYLWSSPQLFFLAREVHYDLATESFTSAPPNCWFVHLAASTFPGNPIAACLRHAPHPLPYAAWCRRNNTFHIHVYPWDKLTRSTKRTH